MVRMKVLLFLLAFLILNADFDLAQSQATNGQSNLDVAVLKNEYFAAWYGPASEPAMAFWDEMEAAIEHSIICGDRDHLLSLIYTPELIETVARHLAQVSATAEGNPSAESHVRLDRATFDILLAYKAMERAKFDADWDSAVHHVDAMVESIRPAMQLSRHV